MACRPRSIVSALVGASGEASGPGWTRLNTNEIAIQPHPAVVAAVTEHSMPVSRYPDPVGEPLRSRIAAHLSIPAVSVVVASGADGVLGMIFRAFASRERRVLLQDRTYPFLTNLVRFHEAQEVTYDNPFDVLAAPAGPDDMRIVVNPNSPTGQWISPEVLLEAWNGEGLLVVDEAYVAFAPGDALRALTSHKNWVVVRSFSKSHGLAGLRVGYAVGDPAVLDAMRRCGDPYPVNHAGLAAASAALDQPEYYGACAAEVRRLRDDLVVELRALGWKVMESHANFVFGRPPGGKAQEYASYLRDHHILVRHFHTAPEHLRISIGSEEEMVNFVGLLQERANGQKQS